MTALFLGVLLVGLVLGVFVMLNGTERLPSGVTLPAPHERVSDHVVAAEPSALFNWASMAAFAFGFGLSGYLFTRFSALPIATRIVIAAAIGAGAMTIQSLLIARWAIPSARAEEVDERYLLQGTLARTTREIPADGTGELQYALDGVSYTLPARSLDGQLLSSDVEVVLDRVEDGVAFVEPWARVEQRL
ncbi:MAG: hypothetical protein ABJC26_12055 [Gemmatimonadaceae bacterium]